MNVEMLEKCNISMDKYGYICEQLAELSHFSRTIRYSGRKFSMIEYESIEEVKLLLVQMSLILYPSSYIFTICLLL